MVLLQKEIPRGMGRGPRRKGCQLLFLRTKKIVPEGVCYQFSGARGVFQEELGLENSSLDQRDLGLNPHEATR